MSPRPRSTAGVNLIRHIWVAAGVEARKYTNALVARVVTVLLIAGITALVASLTVAARGGNPQILAQLGSLATATGWDLYLGVAAQVTAAASVLGFGVALSWLIGREFTDGTISALFALPISRGQICAAKLGLYLCWALAVGAMLVVVLGVLGVAMGLGPVSGSVAASLGRLFVLAALSAGLAVPAAWASTRWRGLLAGIGASIGVVVIAQVGVVAGAGAWLPLAAPALWAFGTATVTAAHLALSLTVPALFGVLTLISWQRLQLDR